MAEIVLEWWRIPTLLAGLAMLAMAGVLFFSDPSRQVTRRFALFLVCKGMLFAVLFLGASIDTYGSRLRGYFAIATPFAALWFGQGFRQWCADRRLLHVPGWLLLAVIVPLEIVYAFDLGGHAMIINEMALGLSYVAFALIAWMFIAEARHHQGVRRHALHLGALGFALEPMYMGAFFIMAELYGWMFNRAVVAAFWSGLGPLEVVSRLLFELAPVLATIVLWVGAREASSARMRSGMRAGMWVSWILVVPVGTLLFIPGLSSYEVAWWPFAFQMLDVHWLFHAVAVLTGMTLLGYGILHYRFLDVDVAYRGLVRHGVLGGVALVAFIVAAEVLESFVGGGLSTPAAWAVVLAAALAAATLTYGLRPIRGMAARIAERMVPPDERRRRPLDERMALFLEQVEWVVRNGELDDRQRRRLDHLQQGLGLDTALANPLLERAMAEQHP